VVKISSLLPHFAGFGPRMAHFELTSPRKDFRAKRLNNYELQVYSLVFEIKEKINSYKITKRRIL
jgi:hypothetical protein